MKFGAAYNDLGPENLDFSKMDVSAVPVIMKSDLGRNKKKLADEISCMLGDGKLKSVKGNRSFAWILKSNVFIKFFNFVKRKKN